MSAPVRLNKKTENKVLDRIDAWAIAHANILMPLCLVTLVLLTVGLIYAVTGLCAVESGMLRNFLARGV